MKNSFTLLLALVFTLVACQNSFFSDEISDDKLQQKKTDLISTYELIAAENLSSKSSAKKQLKYKVIFTEDLNKEKIKPTIENIITQITSEDNDVDEVILWFYSDKNMINESFDIGSAVWAPYGELGNVDSKIAIHNIRNNYKIKYTIIENLDEYMKNKENVKKIYNIGLEKRKKIFRDIIAAEDRVYGFQDIENQKVLNDALSKTGGLNAENREIMYRDQEKINLKAKELMSKYKSYLYLEHGINKELEEEISMEGISNNWSSN